MSRNLDLYFDDILQAIAYIRDFSAGMNYSAFVHDTINFFYSCAIPL